MKDRERMRPSVELAEEAVWAVLSREVKIKTLDVQTADRLHIAITDALRVWLETNGREG